MERWKEIGVGMEGQREANSNDLHCLSGSMTTVQGRRGETREKPLVVDKYNQSMGRVDIADQYGCYY